MQFDNIDNSGSKVTNSPEFSKGQFFKTDDATNRIVDNKAHYLVVTGIIVKDGKYLITKRAPTEKAFPNLWTVPGGKLTMEDYTSRRKDTSAHWYNIFENLLKREVMEEVGLNVKNIGYIEIPPNLVTLQSGISNRHSRTMGNIINWNVYITSLSYTKMLLQKAMHFSAWMNASWVSKCPQIKREGLFDIREDGIPTIIVSLFAEHEHGDVKLCPALTDHAWIKLEEAKNYELIEGIYEELEMLDNHLKGKKLGVWKNEHQ